MASLWVIILVARLLYWLYQRHGDRAYLKQWNAAPEESATALPPRPRVAPEHLLPRGRDA